jgi:hypothetical protein
VSLNFWPPSKILQRVTLLPTIPRGTLNRKDKGEGEYHCVTEATWGGTVPEVDQCLRGSVTLGKSWEERNKANPPATARKIFYHRCPNPKNQNFSYHRFL